MAQSNQEFTQMYVPEFKLTQVADINLEKLTNITSSSSAVQVLSQFIAQKGLTEQINVNEFVFILYLNKRNKVVAVTNLAIGGIDMTVMDVRLVFGLGLKCGASAIIVAHNHPTGNLQPSEADRQIGRRIKEVGVLLQINALDFLIITSNNGYYSFADNSEYAHGGMMADGGKVRWQDVYVGDNALVIAENKMGMVVKPYGRRFHLKFPDGSEKTYSSEELEFFKDEEFAKGGRFPSRGETVDSKDLNYDMLDYFHRTNKKLLIDTKTQKGIEGGVGKMYGDFVFNGDSIQKKDIVSVKILDDNFAKGGITEHGLRVGDTIVSEIDANTIVVDNAVSGRRTINISTGQSMAKGGMSDKIVILVKDKKGNVVLKTTSTNKAADYLGLHGRDNFTVETLDGRKIMAKGGRMGFKALSEKVASHYAGKSVPAKYQSEYGKFYDADEAKTVGNKVAAKVYRLQQGK